MEVHRLRTGLTGLARDVFGTFDTHSSPHSEHRFSAPSSKRCQNWLRPFFFFSFVCLLLLCFFLKGGKKEEFRLYSNNFGFNRDGKTRWAVIKETSAIISSCLLPNLLPFEHQRN